MTFQLPDLPYDYDAMEPFIDKKTMTIHHQKHHAGYTKKLNAALEKADVSGQSIEQILEKVSQYPAAVRNNAGGFYNHNLFWTILSPRRNQAPDPDSPLYQGIVQAFGTLEGFREAFRKAALGQFGSGWAWLCLAEPVGELFVTATPNQDNPLMDVVKKQGLPILGLDVWEHAYYLTYQNRRADYVDGFFEHINWKEVNRRYEAARRVAMTV